MSNPMVRRIACIAALGALAYVLWTTTAAPVGWCALLIGTTLIALGARRRATSAGKALLGVGLVAFFIGGIEIEMWASESSPLEHRPGPLGAGYVDDDDLLAYATQPNGSGVDELWTPDEMVYRAAYATDEDAVRISPPPGDSPPDGAVLCFGGSYMFGEALNNEETVAWQAETQLDGRLRFYNFALHGYSSHQMLAMLESGRVAKAVDEPPRFAVYWAIPDHARRAAGKRFWSANTPRYRVGEDGLAVRDGAFPGLDERADGTPALLASLQRVSWIARKLSEPKVEVTEEDVARWVATVRSAKAEVERQFDGCEFHVVFHDGPSDTGDRMRELLSEHDVPMHLVSSILPGFPENRRSWYVHERDAHPSAEAAQLVASYIVNSIIGGPTLGD
ncbi:MAG: hypothetical protein AAGA20_18630 [Planctomycetota bacterium]